MSNTQQQELNNLTLRFRTVGLTAPELKRKKALEAKRVAELTAHRDQLNNWADRFRVVL